MKFKLQSAPTTRECLGELACPLQGPVQNENVGSVVQTWLNTAQSSDTTFYQGSGPAWTNAGVGHPRNRPLLFLALKQAPRRRVTEAPTRPSDEHFWCRLYGALEDPCPRKYPLTDSKLDKLLVFPLSFFLYLPAWIETTQNISVSCCRAKPRSGLVVNGQFGVLWRKELAVLWAAGPAARRRPAELATLATLKQDVGSKRKVSALFLLRIPEPFPGLAGTPVPSQRSPVCLSTVAPPQTAAALQPLKGNAPTHTPERAVIPQALPLNPGSFSLFSTWKLPMVLAAFNNSFLAMKCERVTMSSKFRRALTIKC